MDGADYNFLSRLLHRVAVGTPWIAEMSFDLERAFVPAAGGEESAEHVFIAGLARSGTTALMRLLHGTGEFSSPSYRDMPFALAPTLWSRVARIFQKPEEIRERCHGDGLLIGQDSPEALEEVFWRVFCGSLYLRRDALVPMTADEAVVRDFRRYVSSVLHARGRPAGRYLSKNNNNILRLGSIRRAYPRATVLIPFRAPRTHACSLYRQHVRFVGIHRSNPFARAYMKWLAHHEFGGEHRPFRFGPEPPRRTPDAPEYWLSLWVSTYRYLLESAPQGCHFVSYENLGGEASWERLRSITAVTSLPTHLWRPPPPERKDEERLDPFLLREAERIHGRLLQLAI